MGKKKDLTSDEKQQIVALLSANKTTIQITKPNSQEFYKKLQ